MACKRCERKGSSVNEKDETTTSYMILKKENKVNKQVCG